MAIDLLVVGAGPTGLSLALSAHEHGARVLVVERRTEVFRPSRALIVYPRTLEVLRPLGVTEALVARAVSAPELCLHLGERRIRLRLGDLALPDTEFPHLSLLRQADVEAVLSRTLAGRAVEVRRGTAMVDLRDEGDAVRAVLRTPAGDEEVRCRFVAGCDGRDSTARVRAGIGWRAGAYGVEVVLADAELSGDLEPGASHVAVRREGLVFVFAHGERASWRMLATRPAAPHPERDPSISRSEIQELLDTAGLGVKVTELPWSARIPLQHRLADHFRRGRVFLAGDAAHVHSPAGGQGMNTGIQDAADLGWKLALAARGAGDEQLLLDSYERERRPIAHRVMAMTDLAFWGEASTSPVPALLRAGLLPLVAPAIPLLAERRRLVAEAVRVLSHVRVGYPPDPPWVEGAPALADAPGPGHRVPDMPVTTCHGTTRLHDLLAAPGVHVVLQRDAAEVEPPPLGRGVSVHRLENVGGRGLYAVRPDGYVGYRRGVADGASLRDWLARIGSGAGESRKSRPA